MEATDPMITLVTYLWNGEMYGFPWREILAELIFNDESPVTEAVFVCPMGQDGTLERIVDLAVISDGKIHVCPVGPPEGSKLFSTYINAAIELAKNDFILQLDCDEIIKAEELEEVFVDTHTKLLSSPMVVVFPRLDFTCSASHVTPIFEGEPPVARLMAKRWYPDICSSNDAMHLQGRNTPSIHARACIFHYHGLLTEKTWQTKETKFQELYADQGLKVDERLKKGWGAWFEDGKTDRRYPLKQTHPRIMWPWLLRADMYLRDPFRSTSSPASPSEPPA